MAKQLFGTDGIRAVAGEYPLDPATIFAFGAALGRDALGAGEILVGADTRESSPWIAELVAGGLESSGAWSASCRLWCAWPARGRTDTRWRTSPWSPTGWRLPVPAAAWLASRRPSPTRWIFLPWWARPSSG